MPFGFEFREALVGTYHLLASPFEERTIRLSLLAKVRGIRRFARDRSADLRGTIELEGFAKETAIDGTLRLDVTQQYRLPYDISFQANDGLTYRFYGERDLRMVNLPEATVLLPGGIFDAGGREIGRTLLRGDLSRDVLLSLKSFRLHFAWSQEKEVP